MSAKPNKLSYDNNYILVDKFETIIQEHISYARNLIKECAWNKLDEFLHSIDSHEVASIIESLNTTNKIIVFRLLSEQLATDVFMNLEGDEQEKLLFAFTDNEAGLILTTMDPDDRTKLLGDLPPAVVTKLLKLLPMDERYIANTLLNYPEYSAGRIMTPEFIVFSPHITASDAIALIKSQSSQKETIYTSYIVDFAGTLIGSITLEDLILSSEDTKVEYLMKENPISASTQTDQEEIANLINYYEVMVLPITDKYHRLVGIVTSDDILHIIQEETTEDFQRFTGINPTEVSYLSGSLWSLVINRSGWIVVLLFVAGFSQDLILRYGELLRDHWIDLSLFFTVLIGVGGNVGSQSSILVIRGIATGEITSNNILQLSWRALLCGVIMGFILSAMLLLRIFIFQTGTPIRWIVGVAMFFIIVIANFLGAMLPLILKKIGIDPAIVSAPLISTIIDLAGLLLYLEIAHYFFKYSILL